MEEVKDQQHRISILEEEKTEQNNKIDSLEEIIRNLNSNILQKESEINHRNLEIEELKRMNISLMQRLDDTIKVMRENMKN